ncbi:MAG TPA: aminotransferase class IV [Candidatus Paceibacterota bacterium]|nr:aminotransferase class IV [Candidatus Paceibacterota bacterium]
MPAFCYFNGTIMPVADAKVGIYDIGLLRGFGIYEALRTFGRKPFHLADHLKRFHVSAEGLGLHIPASDEEIAHTIDELIAKNIPEGREALARFILTGGPARAGIEHDQNVQQTFYILVEPLDPIPADVLTRGCSLIVFEHQRPFPATKTTNYIQAVLLQDERKGAGALEILYTSQGKVLECATSNFFIIKNGTIVTAKKNILEGITRNVTIDVAKKEFPVEERDISVDELYEADEAFLTSSFKDVVPVVDVGGKKIGEGVPGTITRRVMALFAAAAQS